MSPEDVTSLSAGLVTGRDRAHPHMPGKGNLLLRSMSAADFALLAPDLRRVPMPNGSLLAEAGRPIGAMCFPESGIAGFLEVLDDRRKIAVGLLGREGFVGWPLVMGNDRWPHEVVARGGEGTALVIEAEALDRAMRLSPTLHQRLLRYAASFVTQMTGTIVSNLTQTVEQRTARWLLLYHDRIDGDEVAITHEELGVMLGVRRASITDALHQLEGSGAVRSDRGRVTVRDRKVLAALTADTYGKAEAEYDRLIGPYTPEPID